MIDDTQALRLDQNRRPNRGQHRSFCTAHGRRPLLTYVTNHWDSRLDSHDLETVGLSGQGQRRIVSGYDHLGG